MKLNQVTEDVLKVIDSYGFKQEGAYNLRLNGMAVCHGDSRHIAIVKKTDLPGIDIKISGEAQNEQVHIPVVMSEPGLDVVYNDVADVTIVAGCGIHGEGCSGETCMMTALIRRNRRCVKGGAGRRNPP